MIYEDKTTVHVVLEYTPEGKAHVLKCLIAPIKHRYVVRNTYTHNTHSYGVNTTNLQEYINIRIGSITGLMNMQLIEIMYEGVLLATIIPI